MKLKFETPTQKQIEYLEILFIDCGFSRENRNAWLSANTGRDIKYLDQLTKEEASKFISELKEIKEGKLEQ